MKLKIDDEFISHLKPESFGHSLMLMSKNGESFCRLYWYEDDNTTIYLENLSVEECYRKKGFGNKILDKCEEIAQILKFQKIMLTADTSLWMYDWYKRIGYSVIIDTDGIKFAWMSKMLST